MDFPDLGLSGAKVEEELQAPDLGLSGTPEKQKTEQQDFPDLGLSYEEGPSTGEKVLYGFKTMPSFSEGIGDYLERRFPLGRINIYTPGRGFHMPEYVAPPSQVVAAAKAKNYEMAKQLLEQQDQYEVQSMAPWVSTDQKSQGGAAEFAGSVAAALLDPTTLIPIGQSARIAYASAGTVGAADAAAYGLSMEDEIDPALTALGAAGGVVGLGVFRYVGGKLSRQMQAAEKRGVERIAADFETRVRLHTEKGDNVAQAWDKAAKELNLNEDALNGIQTKLGRSLNINGKIQADPAAAEARAGLSKWLDDKNLPNPFRGAGKFMDDIMGSISTRLAMRSPALAGRVRMLDALEHLNTHNDFKELDGWFTILKKMKRNKPAYRKLSQMLFNEDTDAEIVKFLEKNGVKNAMTQVNKLRKVLDRHYNDLVKVGNKMDKVPYYYPRIVKDMPGLLKRMPDSMRAEIELNARKAGVNLGDAEDYGSYINKWLRGRKGKQIDKILGNVKDREIKKLSDEMLDYYEDPIRSLHSMIRRNHTDIQERIFFGRSGIPTSLNPNKLDHHASAGQLIADEIQAGRMTGQDAQVVQELLTSRFAVANRAPSGAIANLKNILYMATIGNPISALTQIGDIGVSAYAHGLRNTMVSIFGRKAVDAAGLGVTDIAQEFASTTATASLLNKVLKGSGFTTIDRFGKDVSINAALRKWQKAAHTPKGVRALRQKYGAMFSGQEMDRLVVALQNKQVTKDVKAMLFSELADLQPITTTEMAVAYNSNPNMRLFYMLKTFTLKQIDIMRRDIWNEFNRGSKTKAMGNAVRYLGLLSFFNLTAEQMKQAILTGEVHPEDVDDMLVSNLFKQFGASEYVINKYMPDGKLGSLMGEILMPPLSVVDGISGVFLDPDNIDQHLKYMPVAGKFWYYWFGDGIERMNKRREQKQQESFRESFNLGDTYEDL